MLHGRMQIYSNFQAYTLQRCVPLQLCLTLLSAWLMASTTKAQYQQQYPQQQYQQQYPQQQYQQQYPQQQYQQQYPQQQYQQQYPQQQYPQQQYPQQQQWGNQQYQQQYPQQQYPQQQQWGNQQYPQQYPQQPPQGAEQENGEEDPFAFEEAPTQSEVRMEAGLGLGVGLHHAELPQSENTQKVRSDPYLMGTAFGIIEARDADMAYGMRLAYRTSVGQRGTVDVPPVDQSPAPPVTEPIVTPARKQEVTVDGLVRVLLDEEEDAVSVPIWLGGGILGFNTDQETSIIEYTIGDFHVQPGLRFAGGPVEVEATGLAGLAFPLDARLPNAGFSAIGFLYGGQLGLDVQIADPLLVFVQARYRQTQFSGTQQNGPFTDMFLAVTFGVAFRY